MIGLDFLVVSLHKGSWNMKATKKHSDRRCDERRDKSRINRPFDISILDHKGEVVNVSTSGVYFEVITNDMGIFPIGTTIPLQIKAVTRLFDGMGKTYLINGSGRVIRNCITENSDHVNCLGVALEFTEKLNTELDGHKLTTAK